jgi:hypothetical protein
MMGFSRPCDYRKPAGPQGDPYTMNMKDEHGRILIALAGSALIILLLTNCGMLRTPTSIPPPPDVVPPAPISGGAFPQSIEGVLFAAAGLTRRRNSPIRASA